MEPESPQFISFESGHEKIIDDLFGQIREYEPPILRLSEAALLSESKMRFSSVELESNMPMSACNFLAKKKLCQLCKTFVLNLKRHIQQVHTKERPNKCTFCRRAFLYPSELRVHLEMHEKNGIQPRPFACLLCNKASYSSQKRLENHIDTIHGKNGFPCTWCNKICDKKFALEAHERTHTGDRPYKCNFCEASFTQTGNLNRHLRTIHQYSDR